MTRAHLTRSRVLAATMLCGLSAAAQAQLANASTAATALGGAYTARGQGYNAVYWNPANLGMPGNQGFSFTLLPFDGQAGIKPIDFARVAPYSGDTIPKSIREQWMLDVERDGGQKGALGGGFTGAGLSLGPIGLQINTKVAADMNLAPGAVEAMLFGNAGRYDTLRTLSLAGSSFQFASYTTGAVSYDEVATDSAREFCDRRHSEVYGRPRDGAWHGQRFRHRNEQRQCFIPDDLPGFHVD